LTFISSIVESEIETVANRCDEVDYFIIGSGTAGVTSGIELADAGFNVVILEAGPLVTVQHIGTTPFRSQPDIVPKIHELVKYESSWLSAEEFERTRDGELRSNNDCWSLVGGRTVFWGGCAPRFIAQDFKEWPFSYSDFEEYYTRAERLMHVSGTSPDRPDFISSSVQDNLLKKFAEAGISAINAPVGVDTEAVANGHISRGFESAVARLLRCLNFVKFGDKTGVAIVPNVVALELQANGDKIEKIKLVDRNTGRMYTIRTKHVVLAGGGIQSTRLVMDSGLEAGSEVVGRYIGDHVFVQGLLKLKKPLKVPMYILLQATEKQHFQVQLQGAFHETWYSPYHSTVWLDSHRDGLHILVYCFGIATVMRDNRLVLMGDAIEEGDHHRHRKYAVVYDRSEADLDLIEEMSNFVPKIAEIFDAEVMKVQTNETGTALHEHGGLRMGADPQTSVTDAFGRFWRYNNLSCADAATWPTQGAANPYLTITAFSLRHAHGLIDEQHKKGNFKESTRETATSQSST
jgi:choline dehydrogenase-like flavoprotein